MAPPADGHAGADAGKDTFAAEAAVADVTILETAALVSDVAETPEIAEPATDATKAQAEVVPAEIAMATCATVADCAAGSTVGPCTEWACVAGHCVAVPRPAGAVCSAVGACVQMTCSAGGACSVPVLSACKAPPCFTATCTLATGACNLAVSATGTCDDGDPCTVGDHCAAGGCTAGGPKACPANPCTAAACDSAAGDCVAAPLPKGVSCSDGNPCTFADACDGLGQCAPGPTASCPSPPCQIGQCDAGSGGCVTIFVDATPCDDGQACTVGDTCASGACVPGSWTCACQFNADCNDGNPCTNDACQGGACSQLPVAPTACDDANACTAGDGCQGGQCLPGAATSCDDGNACTADACLPKTGACANNLLNEKACDDGNGCTVGDTCADGACNAGVATVCAGGGECQAVNCVSATGKCAAVSLAGPCTGTDLCVIGKSCAGGACQGGSQVACDDGNPCTADSCNPSSGACIAVPVPAKVACGQWQACAAGSCSCVLGWRALPAEGKELFRAVQPVGNGFVAVGDSVQAAGSKGLFAVFDAANQPVAVQRITAGNHLSLAAVAVAPAGYLVLGDFADDTVRLVNVDGVGNVVAVTELFAAAKAQDLLAVPDGALALVADTWSAGGKARLARTDANGKLLWTQTIAPDFAGQAALGTALVGQGDAAVVIGQDLVFAAPAQTTGWMALVGVAGNAAVAKVPVKWPNSAVLAAAALAGGQLWAGGGVLNPALGNASDLLVRMDSPLPAGLPVSPTVVAAEAGAAQWAAMVPFGQGIAAVGWRTVNGTAAAMLSHWTANALVWAQTWPAKGGQSLAGAAVLADGTLLAVGSRAAKNGGNEATWLRLAADGTSTCP